MSLFIGTPGADVAPVVELPYPWTFLGVKASQSNDGSATLTVSGGATVAEAALGDSSNPTYLEPTAPYAVDADEAVVLTVDHDGDGGTAGQGIVLIVCGLIGD